MSSSSLRLTWIVRSSRQFVRPFPFNVVVLGAGLFVGGCWSACGDFQHIAPLPCDVAHVVAHSLIKFSTHDAAQVVARFIASWSTGVWNAYSHAKMLHIGKWTPSQRLGSLILIAARANMDPRWNIWMLRYIYIYIYTAKTPVCTAASSLRQRST